MEDGVNIYSTKNSKTHLKEPSIFVAYPQIESKIFQMNCICERFKKTSKRSKKKITDIIIISADLNLNTETIKVVSKIENLTVKSGKEYLMELHFDNNIQGKTVYLKPELSLIIYL